MIIQLQSRLATNATTDTNAKTLQLSPALRNRFTEIWCPQTNDRQDLINIIEHNLKPGIHLCNQEDGTSGIGRAIMDFVAWFTNNDIGKKYYFLFSVLDASVK